MQKINPLLKAMPRSGIRIILDEANKLDDVLHLEIGQPDFPTPGHIVEAAHQAALAGFTGYTPNPGLPSLRQAFADRLEQDYGINITKEQIVVSVGAMGGLFNAFGAAVTAGDEILVPDPGYPNYSMTLRFLGVEPVPYPLGFSQNRFTLDTHKIEPLISRNTRAIVLNSPSNPTGLVADEESVDALIDLADKHDLYLISDEAYDHILFEGIHHSPLKKDVYGRVISIFSCSKTYAMTGWRVGFVVASLEFCTQMSKLQETYVACASSISQKAAEAALHGPQTCVTMMNSTYKKRRDLAVRRCQKLNLNAVIPHGAFYLMLQLPDTHRNDSMSFAMKLLEKTKVAVAPGSTFGASGEGYVRLALCTDERIVLEGLNRIAQFY